MFVTNQFKIAYHLASVYKGIAHGGGGPMDSFTLRYKKVQRFFFSTKLIVPIPSIPLRGLDSVT